MFYISICSQYGIEEVVERIEGFLESLLEGTDGLSLRVFILTSIFILENVWFEMLVDRVVWIVKK